MGLAFGSNTMIQVGQRKELGSDDLDRAPNMDVGLVVSDLTSDPQRRQIIQESWG